ncbi:MAG: NAD(P)-dependent alcohol dehydrogenase [Ardenticatenia bacterium]|nr:NAD(P)-dependent alcohol dehydrogenase [Ardenticatenia bacterium]
MLHSHGTVVNHPRRRRPMRVVVHDRYGPPEVLRIEEAPAPTPAAGEVLVRVHATTVTQTDCHMRRAQPFVWRFLLGLRRPKRRVLGLEFAGVVEAAGTGVTAFAEGDRVFGLRSGAHADYICVREAGLIAHIPEGTTFHGAAAVCDGVSQAWGHLAAGGVGAGTRLLVYGASGSCGTAAVQLGRYLGAHVTAVCTAKNVELMRTLGADAVIDYAVEDFTRNGATYDVILDAVGKHSYLRSRPSLVRGTLRADRRTAQRGVRDRHEVARGQESRRHETGHGLFAGEGAPRQGARRGGAVQARRRPHVPDRGGGRGNSVRRELAEDGQRRADPGRGDGLRVACSRQAVPMWVSQRTPWSVRQLNADLQP